MRVSFNIKDIPLATKADVLQNLKDGELIEDYAVQYIYEYLPDTLDMREYGKRSDYKFYRVPEGEYLVKLIIITDKWVSPGLCHSLISDFGLVLAESHVMTEKSDTSGGDKPFMKLVFEHIIKDLKGSIVISQELS